MEKNKIVLTSYTKINSRQIKDLNAKDKILKYNNKVLQENIFWLERRGGIILIDIKKQILKINNSAYIKTSVHQKTESRWKGKAQTR